MKQEQFAFEERRLGRISVKETSERMYGLGPESLNNLELLTALLRDGEVSWYLVKRFDNDLRLIDQAGIDELAGVKGMRKEKAEIIKAGFELSRRVAKPREANPLVRNPKDVADLVMPRMGHLEREHFKVVSLNNKNRVLALSTISIGTLNASLVDPREVFKEALRRTAAGIILVHNHPSGDPSESQEDIRITRRLEKAGKIIGIEVLDHIIIGDGEFVSMKNKGLL